MGDGYIEHLQKIIDYIEENLKGPISIEECAQLSGFSKFHFHRIFGIYLDVTLMEYVRKRRLDYAMLDVMQVRQDVLVLMCLSRVRIRRKGCGVTNIG